MSKNIGVDQRIFDVACELKDAAEHDLNMRIPTEEIHTLAQRLQQVFEDWTSDLEVAEGDVDPVQKP